MLEAVDVAQVLRAVVDPGLSHGALAEAQQAVQPARLEGSPDPTELEALDEGQAPPAELDEIGARDRPALGALDSLTLVFLVRGLPSPSALLLCVLRRVVWPGLRAGGSVRWVHGSSQFAGSRNSTSTYPGGGMWGATRSMTASASTWRSTS